MVAGQCLAVARIDSGTRLSPQSALSSLCCAAIVAAADADRHQVNDLGYVGGCFVRVLLSTYLMCEL